MIIVPTIMMGWEKGKSKIPKLKLKLLICNCDLWCCANSNSPSAAICPRAQKAQKQVALYKLYNLYKLYTWLWLPSHLCRHDSIISFSKAILDGSNPHPQDPEGRSALRIQEPRKLQNQRERSSKSEKFGNGSQRPPSSDAPTPASPEQTLMSDSFKI